MVDSNLNSHNCNEMKERIVNSLIKLLALVDIIRPIKLVDIETKTPRIRLWIASSVIPSGLLMLIIKKAPNPKKTPTKVPIRP